MMFNNSKYTKLYYKLIEKYSIIDSMAGENHHIIPKSLGGGNDKTNITRVPSRVHFILHKLLVKMLITNDNLNKMKYALWRMMNPQSHNHIRLYHVTSTEYQVYREYVRKNMINNNPMKRPEIAIKFRRKRPEQSVIALSRNTKYWADRKRPLLMLFCKTCSIGFETIIASRICCSKSCSAKYNNKVRRLG